VPAGAHALNHVAPALLRPRDRYAPDIDTGEDRDDEHPHERRSDNRQRIVSVRALVASEREPVQVDLDAFGKVDVDCAENTDGEDRDHVTVERCLAEIEIDVAQANEAADAPSQAKSSLALA